MLIFLRNFFLSISILLFLYANFSTNYNILLIAIMLIWTNNILYALQNIYKRLLFFFFHITFWVFLIGRPVIGFVYGENWVGNIIEQYCAAANVWKGLILLALSLYCLFVGALLCERHLSNKNFNIMLKNNSGNLYFTLYLRNISIITYLISAVFTFILGYEKIQFIQAYTYVDYYISFKSQLPYLFYVFSTFMKYSLCFFLATSPPKKYTTWVIVIYVLSAVPDLFVGERNPIVLTLLFTLIYYMVRDFYGSNDIWIGKKEKLLMLIMIPFTLAFLGVYNYIRVGVTPDTTGFGSIILDLFYKQGVSFAWLCSGLGIYTELSNYTFTNYTFGGIIDYLQYGEFGKWFLGNSGLGNGNTLLKVQLGNSMAHHLSYRLLGDAYLQGHGCGSSYILETFVDYGYAGVMVFNLFLGYFLIYAIGTTRHGVLKYSLLLLTIEGVLFMPRSQAMEPFLFLFQIQFWFPFLLCFGYSVLLSSSHSSN